MKIAVYNCREDETALFEKYGKEYSARLSISALPPTPETAHFADGCDAVNIITTPIDRNLIDIWHGYGIKTIATRTVGYEHVDYEYAKSLGISVSNVSYTPHTVAEYTVMSILMAIRKMKAILTRYIGQDFSLKDIRGRELCNMTVGVIGTGKIGEMVIKNLSGFGCRILAYTPHEKDSVRKYAEYCSLDKLYRESDIITLHTPALPDTCGMINRESIGKMKNGVILINMARGVLVDTGALIEALENGKVAAAALDVVEGESAIYYKDFKYKPVGHHEMAILQAMPNVIMTPHTAFFTDEAVGDMVRYSIENCVKDGAPR